MSTTTGHVLDPPPMDPRIRARRIEVARSARRRRLHRLVELGLLVAVTATFAMAVRSPLLDVDQVRVAGIEATPSDAVLAAVGIAPGEQLVDVDLGAAAERVAGLPWVHTVQAHRSVRGTVSFQVTERTPVAVVATAAGGQMVVDVEGRVLAPAPGQPGAEDLVRVAAGPVTPRPGEWLPEELAPALVLADRLASAAPGTAAVVRGGDDLRVRLAEGGVARFGDTTRLDAKLVALETVLAQVDRACLGVLDLRLPGNPVLTRERRCS
jgi:cell division protein FtsQ